MGGFVLVLGTPRNRALRARLEGMVEKGQRAEDWRWARPAPDVIVGIRGGLSWRQHAANLLWIGDVFPTPDAARSVGDAPSDPLADLVSHHWGRYVAAARQTNGSWSVLRDPSGAVDCATWTHEDLRIVASEAPPWLEPTLPLEGVDEETIAGFFRDPTAIFAGSAVRGLVALNPGERATQHGVEALWTPGAVIRAKRMSLQDGLARFPEALDHCLETLTAGRGPLLVEVSGGFDSSVVASSLSARARRDVAGWLNLRSRDAQGDERSYARALGEHLGAKITELEKPPGRLDVALLRSQAAGFRPAVGSVDQAYDTMIAAQGRAMGARALVSGQGGDTLFFQPPSELIAVDYLAAKGWWRLLGGPMLGLAKRRRQSIWRLALRALRTPLEAPLRAADGDRAVAFLNPDLGRSVDRDAHPWRQDLAGVLPAKRLQILALILAQRRLGLSQRSDALEIIDPLLAQPMVEIGLGLSAFDLALNGQDRGLARLAFQSRLPTAILERKGKGSGGAWFGHMVNASLPQLRPLLLEGELARRRIIDRTTLEACLDPDVLIAQGGYLDLLDAAAVEVWLQAWTARLARASSAALL